MARYEILASLGVPGTCSLKRNYAPSTCVRAGEDKVAFTLFCIRGWKRRLKSDRYAATGCRLGGSKLGGKYRPLSLTVATSKGCDVCAITWALRGRVVTEVDAVVEGYQESIGIPADQVNIKKGSDQQRCHLQLPDDPGPLTPVKKRLEDGMKKTYGQV